MSDDGDRRRGVHPSGEREAPEEPTRDEDTERYRTGHAEAEVDEEPEEPEAEEPAEGFFDRIPENVIPLGAGSLFTSCLLTAAGAVFFGYSAANTQWYGFSPYQITMATVLYTFSAVFQASGVYFARKRSRWLWVMLACFSGALSFVGIPFAILAVICLGLGKNHFASHTAMEQIRGAA